VTICISVDGTAEYQSDAPANEILVGTVGGVLFLNRESKGAPWREARRALEGKHVSSLAPDPKRGLIFAGVYKDGVYVSKDGGQTWDKKVNGMEFTDVYSVNLTETNGEVRLYAGTEPAHLYLSKDLGETWEELPALRSVGTVDKWSFPAPPHIGHVKHITFDPRSSDVMYASVEVGGALKSEDGGRTWRDLPGVYEDVHRVVIPPTQPDNLYTTGGEGVWHSANAGGNWIHLSPNSAGITYPDGFVLHPENPDLMFASGSICSPGAWRQAGTADSRIARSRDRGETWERLGGGLPENLHGNFEALMMNTFPGGFSLTTANTDGEVYHSDDGGETWTRIAQGVPAVSKGGHYRNIPGGPALAGAH